MCAERCPLPFLLVAAVITACKPQKLLQIRQALGTKEVSLSELRHSVGEREVEVNDYYLQRRVRYRTLPLVALLRAWAPQQAYDEVLFHCADGYEARVSRTDLERGLLDSFFLAYGEGGERFRSMIQQGKAQVSAEPFYAVSTDPKGYVTLSWPYEVVGLEFIRVEDKYPGLLPRAVVSQKDLRAGFDLYRKECLRCHSLNLIGGKIGPELNIPRNITEYRDDAYLRAFIRNAPAFRAGSKMPPFQQLTHAELGQIIRYLRAMVGHKAG